MSGPLVTTGREDYGECTHVGHLCPVAGSDDNRYVIVADWIGDNRVQRLAFRRINRALRHMCPSSLLLLMKGNRICVILRCETDMTRVAIIIAKVYARITHETTVFVTDEPATEVEGSGVKHIPHSDPEREARHLANHARKQDALAHTLLHFSEEWRRFTQGRPPDWATDEELLPV